MEDIIKDKQVVYATHVIEGDINYVLIGSGFTERLSGNKSKLKCNRHHCKELQKVYNRIGECKLEILEIAENDILARDLENDYMDYYRRIEGVVVLNKYPAVCSKEYRLVLDEQKVREIKELLAEGKISNNQLAKTYNCDPSLISKIKTGLLWSNVQI